MKDLFLLAPLDGVEIVLLKGRYHYYEGWTPQQVVMPYFALNEMGVESVITINAVGGIKDNLKIGDIFMITDHINAMGDNPLRGIAIQRPEHQFTDMFHPYYEPYQNIAKNAAKELGLKIKKGVYLAIPGPCYETKSEIKMFHHWGADTVGMSTVFEVIACNFLEMKVLAFSLVTDLPADVHQGEINHDEVLEAIEAASPRLLALITACAKQILD